MGFIDRFKINRALRRAGNYDLDGILERVGLQRRNVGAQVGIDLGFFAVGAVFGAVAGLFFAPRAGVETREGFKRSIGDKGLVGGIGEQLRHPIQGRV